MHKCSKNLLPNKRSIQRWVQSFKDRGSVENKNKKAIDRQSHSGRPNLRSPEKINAVRDSVVENPKRSVRCRSLELQIPRESLRKILKENLALNPYKIQTHQRLIADNAKADSPCASDFWIKLTVMRHSFKTCGSPMKPIFIQTAMSSPKITFSGAQKSIPRFTRKEFTRRR